MSLIDAVRRRFRVSRDDTEVVSLLGRAEAMLRSGGSPSQVRALAGEALVLLEAADGQHNDERLLRLAAAQLLAGNLEEAARFAGRCANARPYDVDSRIVHGNVCLARNELEAAAHEFDAVIEEFGADADAAAGRRAVILARGEGPYDELPAGVDDWRAAATLLVGLWAVSGQLEERRSALRSAQPDTLALLDGAAERIGVNRSSDGTV